LSSRLFVACGASLTELDMQATARQCVCVYGRHY